MKQEMLTKDNPIPFQEVLSFTQLQENTLLDWLPSAAYICDKSGTIIKYNEEATKLWGRVPGDTDEKFSGAFRLYNPDGSWLPHEQTPVAACLKDGKSRKDVEIILERPDHSRRHVKMNIVAIKDEQGQPIGVVNSFYDITEQKKTEKELERKTKELQDYVDNGNIGLHWVDGDGIIKWANKAELSMLGYLEEEYIGHHIAEFHVKQEKINDILQRLSCNETLSQYESELRCKDGSIKSVQINSSVYWEDGNFIHTRCFTVDVTEQKKTFQALKESESRNKKLVQSLKTPLYTTDAEGRITLYNQAAVELWGREPEIGKDLWCGSYKIFNTDGSDLPLEKCPMAICLKEQRPVSGEEILVARPDGTLRNVAPHPQPLFDDAGKIVGAVNMLIDITELKQVEQALRESEARYRDLTASLERTIDGKTNDLRLKTEQLKKSEERYHKMVEEVEDYAIILLDKDGIVQNWNKGAEKIKGYKDTDIVGKSFSTFYLPEDRERNLPRTLLEFARQTGKATHEGWRRRKDGSAFWGSIVLTALHDDEHNVIGFSKVTRDLTERKLAEDKLKEYTRQLEFQNKELEEFAYAASHDMKEPLRKIIFYNSHLWENAADKLSERERDYLNRSVMAAQRMRSLIDDLLEYSRASMNTQEFESVDLNGIVDEVVFAYKELIEQKEAIVSFSSLPIVKGIPFQLRQLFDNLLSNALKYQHAERNPVIKIQAEKIIGDELEGLDKEIEYHKITVSDNGIGFLPESAEKIFELFHRLTADKFSGTGVGLALCKKIVQNHDGIITASGTLNEGATFGIYLPA